MSAHGFSMSVIAWTIPAWRASRIDAGRALGTKEPDKRHRLYDGGHRNLVTRPDLIGEVFDWFDRYLGPTQTR